MKGHAGYNPGNDIVCSAISNSSYMLLNYLMQMDDPYILEDHREEPGDFRVSINRNNAKGKTKIKLDTALKCFYISVKQIADTYPKYCEVEVINDAI